MMKIVIFHFMRLSYLSGLPNTRRLLLSDRIGLLDKAQCIFYSSGNVKQIVQQVKQRAARPLFICMLVRLPRY